MNTLEARRRRLRVTAAIAVVVVVLGAVALAAMSLLGGDDDPTATSETGDHSAATGGAGDAPTFPGDGPYVWSPVEIGGGGFVTGLATAPTGEVYARTDVGGAYRWDRGEERWHQMITAGGVADPVSDDFGVASLAAAPSDGQVVYAATGGTLNRVEGRVLRSDDGGRTWRSGDERFPIDGNARWRQGGERLAVHPDDPDTALFGTRSRGLWRTDDGGTTWERLPGLPEADVGDDVEEPAGVSFVTFAPTNGGGPAIFAGVQNVGILRSDDGGTSFEVVHALDGGVPRHADLVDGKLHVAVQANPAQLVRVDVSAGTAERIEPDTDEPLAAVAVDPADPGRIVVAAAAVRGGDLWRTDDGGSTWTALDIAVEADDPSWPAATDVGNRLSTGALAFDPLDEGSLWFAEGMGVWRTDDLGGDGITWQFTSNGIEELVSSDAVKPPGHPLLTAHWDRPVFRHPDGGPAEPVLTDGFNAGWDLDVAPGDPSFVVAVVSDHRACCQDDPDANESGFSTDGGATWQRFGSLRTGDHPRHLRFGNIAVSSGDTSNLVWVPSRGRPPHHSTDGGDTWTRSDYPGSEAHGAHYLRRRVLTADPVEGGTFYVLDADGVLRSTDGGATWELREGDGLPGPESRRFNATMAAVPGRSGDLLASFGELGGDDLGLLRSTDGGDTWEAVPGIAEVGTFGFGAPARPEGPPAIFASGVVGGDRGVWRSDDDGGSWELVADHPADRHQSITVVTGDPEVHGRVHVGFTGTGFVTGEPRQEP